MYYYKIVIAKDAPFGVEVENGYGMDTTYILAPDNETADCFAEEQAASYGCSIYSSTCVMYNEIADDFDMSRIIEVN